MNLIAGLGNPGPRYEGTRHNAGFQVVDRLASGCEGVAWRSKFQAELAQVELFAERVLLLKPQTFMNLSGRSVQPACAFFKIPLERLLVVHDEIDLNFGRLQLKRGGGEAGNNGLRSISEELGSSDYLRLRVGVGRPGRDYRGDVADYVLEGVPPADREAFDDLIDRAAKAVGIVLQDGVSAAMNRINRKQ